MLLSTLLVLATAPVGPALSQEALPEVGVPFACGRAHTVSQGHDTGSHLHYDTWAWDFRMPTGTPVVAALDGVVRMARGDSTLGGCDPAMARHANYVVVTHGQGLETQYLHFSSVVVRPGERVRRGQVLGFSGNTGWSCGPHLHFKVARTEGSGWNNPSVPARILGYGDPSRDTLVSAPPCAQEPTLLARPPAATPSVEPPTAVAPAPARAPGAIEGTPAGAREVLERTGSPPAQGPSAPAPATAPAASTVQALHPAS